MTRCLYAAQWCLRWEMAEFQFKQSDMYLSETTAEKQDKASVCMNVEEDEGVS